MKTVFVKQDPNQRAWHVIDAKGKVLGRIATKAAMLLMGKHKPTYTPFLDNGDHVIIVNADQVVLTGHKEDQKYYRTHSGYPGGLKEVQASRMRQTRPVRMIELAVRGMLPKSVLGKHMGKKLMVYAGDKHPHAAQSPVALAV